MIMVSLISDITANIINIMYLLNEFLRSTLGLGGLFGISHLKASEVESGMVPCQHSCNRAITISSRHVIESGGELRGMAGMVVPPVNSRNLRTYTVSYTKEVIEMRWR